MKLKKDGGETAFYAILVLYAKSHVQLGGKTPDSKIAMSSASTLCVPACYVLEKSTLL